MIKWFTYRISNMPLEVFETVSQLFNVGDLSNALMRAINLINDQKHRDEAYYWVLKIKSFQKSLNKSDVTEIPEKIENPYWKAKSMHFVIDYYKDRGEIQKAVSIGLDAKKVFEESNKYKEAGKVFVDLGLLAALQGHLIKASLHFNFALKYLDDKTALFVNMGILKWKRGFYSDAIDILNSTYEEFFKVETPDNFNYSMYSLLYLVFSHVDRGLQGDYDSANGYIEMLANMVVNPICNTTHSHYFYLLAQGYVLAASNEKENQEIAIHVLNNLLDSESKYVEHRLIASQVILKLLFKQFSKTSSDEKRKLKELTKQIYYHLGRYYTDTASQNLNIEAAKILLFKAKFETLKNDKIRGYGFLSSALEYLEDENLVLDTMAREELRELLNEYNLEGVVVNT